MASIRVQEQRLVVEGNVGYDQAGELADSCTQFFAGPGHDRGVVDLSTARMLTSKCVAAIYEAARIHGPVELRVIVPERLAQLFAPGEMEGLFAVTVA